jgi:signal recognition particle receptor subunit beta
MVLIDRAFGVIHYKLVYYGPPSSGKTSNLCHIYEQAPVLARSEWMREVQDHRRALTFHIAASSDLLVDGLRVCFHLYTVPGAVLHWETWAAALAGADGVVFVANSSPQSFIQEANRQSVRELEQVIDGKREPGIGATWRTLPVVMQWNKRDVEGAVPLADLHRDLNGRQWPSVAATAAPGRGVKETFQLLRQQVITRK